MSASSSPQGAKKVGSKWGMVKIGKNGKKLRNIKKMMFILHISANGNLSLELEEFNGGTPMGFHIFLKFQGLKIRILRPRCWQHCERKAFKFLDNRTKIRASVDKRSKSASLLHED